MKLPSRIELNNSIASQRKAQIDEGVRIAQKVDILRQKNADITSQHETYISGMERELHERTDSLIKKVAELGREVETLEERKRLAVPPLEEDVDRFREAQKELERFRLFLEERDAELLRKEKTQAQRDVKSKELMVKVKSRDRASVKAYEKAEQVIQNAEKLSLETEAKVDGEMKRIQQKDKDLHARDRELLAFESSLNVKEEQLREREETVVRDKLHIASQQASLQVAWQALKEKGL